MQQQNCKIIHYSKHAQSVNTFRRRLQVYCQDRNRRSNHNNVVHSHMPHYRHTLHCKIYQACLTRGLPWRHAARAMRCGELRRCSASACSTSTPAAVCQRKFTAWGTKATKPRRIAMVVQAVAAVGGLLKTYAYDDLSTKEIRGLLQRPRIDFTSILATVGR